MCTDFLVFFIYQVPGSVGSSLRSLEKIIPYNIIYAYIHIYIYIYVC